MTRTGLVVAAIASLVVAGCASSTPPSRSSSAAAATVPQSSSSAPRLAQPKTVPPPSTASRTATASTTSTAAGKPDRTTPASSPTSSARRRPTAGSALPLSFSAGSATQVITVVAPSRSSTQGTLQTWRKVVGGWHKVGPVVHAWLGSSGLSRHTRESLSATPIGSFTLTQAFGHDANPGTTLPYLRTTPADWWVSEAGPLYNTHQRCSTDCAFTRGSPNEHLYYEMPFYTYAVVIDYNTSNAPGGVQQGAGSAFFLHVTDGTPTAGCVAIARDQLVRILRWLKPGHAPRILIGVG